MRVAQDNIVGLTAAGEAVEIRRGTVLTLHSELRDWRRVQVKCGDSVLSVSRAAWQNSVSSEDEPRMKWWSLDDRR